MTEISYIETQRQNQDTIAFVKTYENNVTIENASEVFRIFNENQKEWRKYLPCVEDCMDENNKLGFDSWYGRAIVIYTAALGISENLQNQENFEICQSYIDDFEKNDTFSSFSIKNCIYNNLGLGWRKIGNTEKAKENYRKSIYFELKRALHSHNSFHNIRCFQYKPCSKYLFQSLINNTLNVSSPSVFNDLFDTPIITWMADDLLKETFDDCIKVACFTSNRFLPSSKKGYSEVEQKSKHKKDEIEYKKNLMWAHYADSHRGICVKYCFPSDMTIDSEKALSFWGDVWYTDDVESLYQKKEITEDEAFFAKAKTWEYENELRFFFFEKTGTKSCFTSVPMQENYIEAIYFGVNCSSQDREAIINILKERKLKLVTWKRQGNDVKEIPIKFYQMKLSKNKFGELEEEEIQVQRMQQ